MFELEDCISALTALCRDLVFGSVHGVGAFFPLTSIYLKTLTFMVWVLHSIQIRAWSYSPHKVLFFSVGVECIKLKIICTYVTWTS